MYNIKPEIYTISIKEIISEIMSEDNVMILTTKNTSQKNGLKDIFSKVEQKINKFQFIDDVPAEAPFSYLKKFYQNLNFLPNIIIAIGGGSVLDLAKAVSCASNFEEIEAVFYKKQKLKGKYAKVYACPTTFGTGAEMSFGAILYDDIKNVKGGIRSGLIQADKVIMDFELYKTAPRKIKALSGFDCFTHALETYLSKKSNDIVRYQSLTAINIIFENLERAVNNDHESVKKMAITSMLMGVNLAYSTTCLPHRMQYVIGPMTGTSHAEGLAAIYKGWLFYVKKQNRGPFNEICKSLKISEDKFIEKVNNIKENIEISIGLADLGIVEDDYNYILENLSGNLNADPYYLNGDSVLNILKLAQ